MRQRSPTARKEISTWRTALSRSRRSRIDTFFSSGMKNRSSDSDLPITSDRVNPVNRRKLLFTSTIWPSPAVTMNMPEGLERNALENISSDCCSAKSACILAVMSLSTPR